MGLLKVCIIMSVYSLNIESGFLIKQKYVDFLAFFFSFQIKNSTFKEFLISQNPGGFSLVESQNLSIF